MATTKKSAPKPAAKAAKKPGTALTVWEKEMEAAAVAQSSVENTVGGFKSISTRGGILAVDDNPVPDNELRVIILGSVYENMYYPGAFDASNPQSPACYAFGKTEDELAPDDDHNVQDKQHDVCSGCWANEWSSADVGKGKACKNTRRMLLITEDALESPEAMAEAEMRMLKLPVMSVKGWVQYVKQTLAEDVKRPSWGVVTTISVVPDAKSQFKVQFTFEEAIDFDDAIYAAMQKKVKEAEGSIIAPYPVFEEEEKPKGRKVVPIKNQRSTPVNKTPTRPAAKAPAKAPVKGKGKY